MPKAAGKKVAKKQKVARKTAAKPMAVEVRQGSVALTLPPRVAFDVRAGTLSVDELKRLVTARSGVGLTCEATAAAMRKYPDRLAVPAVSPDDLEDKGFVAEKIDEVIADLDVLKLVATQGNRLADAAAHDGLRRVLAFVRAQEKFDPTLASLVPQLILYFSNEKPEPKPAEP